MESRRIDKEDVDQLYENEGAAPISRRLEVSKKLSGRKRTDSAWQWIFLFFVLATLILSILAIKLGQPDILSKPADPNGRICGQGEMKEYPYIYFTTPAKEFMYRAACVKKCPQLKFQPKQGSSIDCAVNRVVTSCTLNISPNDRHKEVLIYDSKAFLEKVCMPRNILYFTLISQALSIGKVEQALTDLRQAILLILAFSFLALVLSVFTQQIASNESKMAQIMRAYFIISTLGFFLITVFSLASAVMIASGRLMKYDKVIESDKVISATMQKVNTSWIVLLIIGIVSLVMFVFISKAYLKFEVLQIEQQPRIMRIRNNLIVFSSKLFKELGMNVIPIVLILLCIGIFFLFVAFEMNIFAVGESQVGEKTLPFEHFHVNPFAYGVNVFVSMGFFWAFVFVLQSSEFLSYAISVFSLDLLYNRIPHVNTQDSKYKPLFDEIKATRELRIGTIAKCSLLTFPTFYLRQILENIDTAYQRSVEKQKGELQKQQVVFVSAAPKNSSDVNASRRSSKIQSSSQLKKSNLIRGNEAEEEKEQENDVPHSCSMKVQSIFVRFYRWTGLKKVQPYGFIHTIIHQTNFLEAGAAIQDSIDQAPYWYEDMLDGGEIFEVLVKCTITLVITILFFVANFLTSENVAQTMAPTIFILITSYTIANVYVSTYASIYSCSIAYYLLKHGEFLSTNTLSDSDHLGHFEDYAASLHAIEQIY